MTGRRFEPRYGRSHRERGVVLYVAIIVLVAMTLAGLAMMRQMGSGASIAGNVAFKENATSVADRGAEAARQWIMVNQAALNNDNFAFGYHSSWSPTVDPTQFAWDTQSMVLAGGDVGNAARVYIERLCVTPGMSAIAPTQVCSDKPMDTGNNKGGGAYPSVLPPTPPQPYYRVTTRVDGPRNTRSYVQVLMQ